MASKRKGAAISSYHQREGAMKGRGKMRLTKLEYFAAHAQVEIPYDPSIPYYEALVGRKAPQDASDYTQWRKFWDDAIAVDKISQAESLLAALKKRQRRTKGA